MMHYCLFISPNLAVNVKKHYKLRQALWTCLLLLSLSMYSRAFAQDTYHFDKGLMIQVPYNYGREAVYTDELLWEFYRGGLSQPEPGTSLSSRQDSCKWVPVKADTSGFLRIDNRAEATNFGPNHPPGPGRLDTARNSRGQWARIRPSYIYLTYQSTKAQDAIMNIRGNSAVLVNGKLHTGDPYRMGWMEIPIHLHKGVNEFYVRGNLVSATLHFPKNAVYLSTADATLPDIVEGKAKENLLAGIVIINNSAKHLQGLSIISNLDGKASTAELPAILPYSSRKISVPIDASSVNQLGEAIVDLSLKRAKTTLDKSQVSLRSIAANTPYKVTFISAIDGSLQYYAVNPSLNGEKPGDALFFSVHGAGVEALGQAQAYQAKDWGNLVAPTNRRPRGFNWEDWGRLDALEVLAQAKQSLQPDSQRIYLTGHSMGGHGTWFLGVTYPDKWAAIAPCAGYPTLKGYGSADGLIPEQGRNSLENILLRASNQSDVIAYARNYKPLGVYILHGDADRVVPIDHARQMRQVLGEFHPDFSYYEYPGGSHWYSNESVDWKPLFDYFKWHKRQESPLVNHIDFTTPNPGISYSYYWAGIYQQQDALEYSNLVLDRDLTEAIIKGHTKNVAVLALNLQDFVPNQELTIQLDSLETIRYQVNENEKSIYLNRTGNRWELTAKPSPNQKGPHRNGSFKEAFNHGMVYVYGTQGTPEENQWALEKATYDAASWYYRGNGAFDLVADRDFDAKAYVDRNIILVGNAASNGAWKQLLSECPIKVTKDEITINGKHYKGNDLGGYFSWKKTGSDQLSIGIITGTGIRGMQAASANQYFAGASGFPDYMFFTFDILKNGSESLVEAGFYSNDWQINP